jgi:hypothetical protein
MKSVTATAAAVTLPPLLPLLLLLLLLESPGAALAQGTSPGRASDSVDTKDNGSDVDRSILLEWRASSPPLQKLWSDKNAPLTAWERITVNKEGRVVNFKLWRRDLTGVVLEGLTALKKLDLSWNKLTSVQIELRNLAALEELNLNFNNLKGVPAELGGSPH